ncbi:hypothetical protein FBU59_005606, partial [Linderina macrospora]
MSLEEEIIDIVDSEEQHGPTKKLRIDEPTSEQSEQKPLTQEHIFQNLRLRRIVRENHSSTIAQLALYFYRPGDLTALNTMDCDDQHSGHGLGGLSHYERRFDKRGAVLRDAGDNSNLLGTVGATQANIYDNENLGDHLDIMSHYQLPEDSAMPFHTCCWVHTPGDALLAMGGEDKLIHIISLGWSREIRVLRGHTGTVVDLQMHPTDHRLLASAGKDKTVRIWSVQTGECLCRYETDATAIRFHPDGKSLLTGSSQGEIRQWPVPTQSLTDHNADTLVFQSGDSTKCQPAKKYQGAAIDCIRLANGRVLSKNMAGRIEYWNLDTYEIIRAITVRSHGLMATRFDVSHDDSYLC